MKCFDPTISRTITLKSKKYLLNDRFYLKDFSTWDKDIRDWLISQEKLELGQEHHFIISFLREKFSHANVAPGVRAITAELQTQFGKEKGSVRYFHTLFPGGIHQAYLIAGLPMMDSCC